MFEGLSQLVLQAARSAILGRIFREIREGYVKLRGGNHEVRACGNNFLESCSSSQIATAIPHTGLA